MSQFKVLSQLMQNQRLATPVPAGTQMCAARDATGELELFSIGSSAKVYQTYQDPASDTGWSVRDLAYPGKATTLACYKNQGGTITLVAADGKSGIYMITLPSTPGGTLPKWTQLPSIPALGISMGMDPGGAAAIVVYSAKDYNFYQLQVVKGKYTWGTGLRTTSPLSPVSAWCYSQVYDTDDWSGPAPGAVWTPDMMAGDGTSIVSRGWWGGSGYGATVAGNWGAMSSCMNAQGRWDVFAINNDDQNIYYLQAPVGSNSWNFTSAQISSVPCKAVSSGHFSIQGQFQLAVFALDSVGVLRVTQQDSNSATGWGDLIALNQELLFTQFCTALTGQGNTEVFAASSTGTVYHVWQDPETTDWNFDEVEAALNGQLEDVPTYQTVVQVMDNSGQPLAYTPVMVSAVNGDSVVLEINGQYTLLMAGAPWSGTTNSAGSLIVNQATSALRSPVLMATAADGTSTPPIDASGSVQTTLSTVTGQELIDAGLLAPQYQGQADDVATALQQVMQMAPQTDVGIALAGVHPGSTMAVLRGTGGKAAPARQAWSFDVDDGSPKFRLLNDEEAAAMRAKLAQLPKLDSSILPSLSDLWGEMVSAVENGAVQLTNWFIQGAEAMLTVIVDGITYVYQATIGLVEDALDLAEQILTTVRVFFTDLFNWLGYIFDWQNILRTQQAVMYSVNTVLSFFSQAAGVLQKQIDANLQSFANNQLAGVFSQVESFLGANTSFAQYQAQNQQPLKGLDAPQAQLMVNHMVQNAPAATSGSSASAAASVTASNSALQDIINKVEGLLTTYGANQKIQDALNFFAAALDTPDQFLQLVLDGALALIEAAVLTVVAGVQLIIDAVLSAVSAVVDGLQAIFNTPWTIPVISQIYQRMTTSSTNPNGLPLTAMSLLGLLIAAPVTVVYTAVEGTAPFPSDSSVTNFEASFTPTVLLTNSGLSGASPRAEVTAAVGDSNPMPLIYAYAHAVALGMTAVAEPPLDLQIPTGVNPGDLSRFKPSQSPDSAYESLAAANLMLEIASLVFSVPWIAGAQSWSTKNSQGWGCYGWVASAIKTMIDGTMFYLTKKLPRQVGDAGTFFEVIWSFVEAVPNAGLLITGAHTAGAAGVIGGFSDFLRIGRLKEFVVETEGISLAVVAVTDVAGNLGQAALTIAAAYSDAESAAATA